MALSMSKKRGTASELDGGGGVLSLDQKQLNDALRKYLKRSPTSTSCDAGLSSKKRDRVGARHVPSAATEESETDSKESDVSDSDGKDTPWISHFCNQRGNEFFCEVDDEYIQDDFNLRGLSSQVPYYDYALDLILDADSSHGDMFTEEENKLIESAAEVLYGLIHARYILTTQGMLSMLLKYKFHHFGRCPRVFCSDQPCLPVGQSDIPQSSTVKIYCPKCEDIYYPRSEYQGITDGAYFGTTFPHLFLMAFEHLKPEKPSHGYVPHVFGFKIH